MATKKRARKNQIRGRILSAALSLGVLAAAGMIGMYTVGKSEQKQQEEELAQKVADAEKAFEEAKAREAELEQQLEEARLAEEKQQASSSDTIAQFQETPEIAAELESDFVVSEQSTTILSAEEQAALDAAAEEAAKKDALAQEAKVIQHSFSPETEDLLWPIAGNIILDYSMDQTVYFATLNQYKYNPAIIIQGQVGQEVLCGADGKVTSIEKLDETGTTVTVDFGDGYEGVYGQLKDVVVSVGSHVKSGAKLGLISEPTRYYSIEGANVYFQILKDGEPVDPMDLLQ